VRDPIFAQLVVDSDGGALLTDPRDPRFAHVIDLTASCPLG
jgi:hypothetical protein